ncbi:MAG: peptidylprolyl isomerase [Elusimicrobia bacterium]|nr:peptidylprolyl isomerase [Elusimicrobiota bacterium]
MKNSSSRALLAFLALCPAGLSAKVMEDTVAVVNGSPILLSEYQKALASAMQYWNSEAPDAMRDPANLKKLRETTLEQLIDQEVMSQEADKKGIKVRERDVENGEAEIKQRFPSEEEFKKQLERDGITYSQFTERLKKQIKARKLIEEAVRPKVKVPEEKESKAYFERVLAHLKTGSASAPKGLSDEEAQAFLQVAQAVKLKSSESVEISQILIKVSPKPSEAEKKRALKTAIDIHKRLSAKPESFEEIAAAESEDPESAAQGGRIPKEVYRGMLPPAMEKAAFALPVGGVSEPILSDFGYQILKLRGKKAAQQPNFADFKDDLSKFLSDVGFQKELEAYVKSLKGKAVAERHLPAL